MISATWPRRPSRRGSFAVSVWPQLMSSQVRGFVSWVRKEAALKARGDGLGDRALCELDVSDARSGSRSALISTWGRPLPRRLGGPDAPHSREGVGR